MGMALLGFLNVGIRSIMLLYKKGPALEVMAACLAAGQLCAPAVQPCSTLKLQVLPLDCAIAMHSFASSMLPKHSSASSSHLCQQFLPEFPCSYQQAKLALLNCTNVCGHV